MPRLSFLRRKRKSYESSRASRKKTSSSPPRSAPERTSRWCVFFFRLLAACFLRSLGTPYRAPLFCSPIPFKTRNNEDHLRPAPCLRRFGRRICPPGLQQGATNEGQACTHEMGNFRFGDRREWPSYFAVLSGLARMKNHGGMLREKRLVMGSIGGCICKVKGTLGARILAVGPGAAQKFRTRSFALGRILPMCSGYCGSTRTRHK